MSENSSEWSTPFVLPVELGVRRHECTLVEKRLADGRRIAVKLLEAQPPVNESERQMIEAALIEEEMEDGATAARAGKSPLPAPQPKPPQQSFVGCLLLIGMIVAFPLALLANCSGGSPQRDENSPNAGLSFRCQMAAETYIRTHLKAPATAKFGGAICRRYPNTSFYTVEGHVDSQNSFGAMLRTSYLVAMEYHGGMSAPSSFYCAFGNQEFGDRGKFERAMKEAAATR